MIRIPVREEADVALARRIAGRVAAGEGFPAGRAAALVIAVSEITRNIVIHAGVGEVEIEVIVEHDRRGVCVIARDAARGIADVDAAMRDGYSTGEGLGLGLPSARRLVDEFRLTSTVGCGTTVLLKKWKDSGGASR